MKLGEPEIGEEVILQDNTPVYTIKNITKDGLAAFIVIIFPDGTEAAGRWINICYLKKLKSKRE